MKKSEIQVGGHYIAKVSGKLVTVRVDAIREAFPQGRYAGHVVVRAHYDVSNLTTGRKLTFRSAAKFRGVAPSPAALAAAAEGDRRATEAEQLRAATMPRASWEL